MEQFGEEDIVARQIDWLKIIQEQEGVAFVTMNSDPDFNVTSTYGGKILDISDDHEDPWVELEVTTAYADVKTVESAALDDLYLFYRNAREAAAPSRNIVDMLQADLDLYYSLNPEGDPNITVKLLHEIGATKRLSVTDICFVMAETSSS